MIIVLKLVIIESAIHLITHKYNKCILFINIQLINHNNITLIFNKHYQIINNINN
jgi:hypothetical protein